MAKNVKKVVIPVAGLGTRGFPFTKEVPKELLPVIDVPAIQFIVEEVVAAGIEQVIFVTSKGKSSLEDHFAPSPHLEYWLRKRGKDELADRVKRLGTLCDVLTVRQKEPLGLGHAILCARPIVGKDPFAVCLGDEIYPEWNIGRPYKTCLRSLIETFSEVNASVVAVVEIPPIDTRCYGIVDIGGVALGDLPLRVKGAVEKPSPETAPSRCAIIGRYVFDPEIFDSISQSKPGMGGEIQLTDAMDMLSRAGRLYAKRADGPRYDVGNAFSYVQAIIDSSLRRPEISERVKQYLKTL